MPNHKLLLLSGSSEGFALAASCAQMAELTVISSFAGRTSVPKKPMGTWRSGGFGGTKGLIAYLREERITAILDATHPFALRMSLNAKEAATQLGLPLLQLWRAPWEKTDGDHWIEVSNLEAALHRITPAHSPVFLTSGRSSIALAAKRTDINFITRVIEPHPDDQAYNNANLSFVYQKGPFTAADELTLLQSHNIKAIVSKNSGGAGAYPKLEAARTLSLPVFMIERPSAPKADYAHTVDEAIHWIKHLPNAKATD